MNFYSAIAENYDHIFPLSLDQLVFVRRHAPVEHFPKLLEIGSATGTLTEALQNEEYDVQGLELDAKMVELATNKYPSINFHCDNMLNIEKTFDTNSLDALVCFGNTLVHLDKKEEMKTFFDSAFNILRNGGILLIQIINYDHIIDYNLTGLPTITNDYVKFERQYKLLSDTKLSFDTVLTLSDNEEAISNSQILYPLRRSTLKTIAQKAGFETKTYGDFKDAIWHTETLHTILICTKK